MKHLNISDVMNSSFSCDVYATNGGLGYQEYSYLIRLEEIDMDTENKNTELDNTDKKLHISDVIDSRTTSWDDIFQNVSESSGLYRLPSGNYIPLKTYLKEKYYPPKIK